MIELNKRLNIDAINNPNLYSVIIADESSQDGPYNRMYSVGADGSNDLSPEVFDGAVRAFAQYIVVNAPNHSVYDIIKATVSEVSVK